MEANTKNFDEENRNLASCQWTGTEGQAISVPLFTSESNTDSEQYSSETSEDFSYKIRSPNGHLKPNSVKLMTNYFSRKNNKKRSELSNKLVTENSQHLKKITQPKRRRKVNKSTEQKLRTKAEKLKKTARMRHTPVDTDQNKNKDAPGANWLSNSDQIEDQSPSAGKLFAPIGIKQSRQEYYQETIFLHHLSQQLKMSAEEHQSEMVVSVNTEEVSNAIQPGINTEPESQTSVVSHVDNQMEINEMSNPEAMSVRSVAEMLAGIRKEMRDGMMELRKDMNELKNSTATGVSQNVVEQCRDDLSKSLDLSLAQDREEVKKLKDDLKLFKFRNRTLTNVVEHMAVEISDLKNRLENVELNNCRNAVSLTGLYLNSKNSKADSIRVIENFLDTNIGVSVIVEDFFRVGASEPKMTVIYFQTAQQKRDVLHFKSYLKNLENEDGRPMFINDYVPSATQERRKRDRDIFNINDNLQSPLNVKYSKGKLTIQGQPYSQKVTPPLLNSW